MVRPNRIKKASQLSLLFLHIYYPKIDDSYILSIFFDKLFHTISIKHDSYPHFYILVFATDHKGFLRRIKFVLVNYMG